MSALVEKQYTLSNLITFDENGLSIAPFVDIKKTLIKRARELYGADIDVSDASVDGQWITELALMFNSCLQAFNNLYADLDPAVAQGKALDLLASFSNIARKPAQRSICNVTLSTTAENLNFKLSNAAEFIDKNGVIWLIDENRASSYLPAAENGIYMLNFTSSNNFSCIVPLRCDVYGPIAIPADTIEGFVSINNDNANIIVTQEQAGIKGSIVESDAHLRARRNHSGANEAITVTDSIYGTLMDNANIIDAYVINHYLPDEAGAPQAMQHTVEVIVNRKYHSIYSDVCDLLDDFIADTILNHLTPGIPGIYEEATSDMYDDESIPISTAFASNARKEKIYSTQIYHEAVQWTEAVAIKPMIRIYIHPLQNMDKTTAATNIIKAVANYANNLGLLNDVEASALLQTILYADPKYQGYSTYYCTPNDIFFDDIGPANTNPPSSFTYLAATHVGKPFESAKVRKTYYDYNDDVIINESLADDANHFTTCVYPSGSSVPLSLIYDEYVNSASSESFPDITYRIKNLENNYYLYKTSGGSIVTIKYSAPISTATVPYNDQTLYVDAYAMNADASIVVIIG